MSDYYILDQNRKVVPAEVIDWARWLNDMSNRRVGEYEAHGFRVSTVFLGLDHSFGEGGPPLLFETMIFPEEQLVWRYSTWDEAEHGHKAAIALLEEYVREGRDLAELRSEIPPEYVPPEPEPLQRPFELRGKRKLQMNPGAK